MSQLCRNTAESVIFQNFILTTIILNAAVMGLETSSTLLGKYHQMFSWSHFIVQAVFITEIGIRILAHGDHPLRFFKNGWNNFDFFVVAASLLPMSGPYATVARLARILRIARIVSISAQLRLLVSTLLRSLPSMAHVIFLSLLIVYIYGIIGFHQFSEIDPEHWGTLGASMLSLFQILTLEGWGEIQRAVMPDSPYSWIFFLSYIIIVVFVVINLFIAIVIDNLQTAKADQLISEDPGERYHQIISCIEVLKTNLHELEARLEKERFDK